MFIPDAYNAKITANISNEWYLLFLIASIAEISTDVIGEINNNIKYVNDFFSVLLVLFILLQTVKWFIYPFALPL